jgi:hypothetical protein
MLVTLSRLRCNTAQTRVSVGNALIHVKRPQIVIQQLVDHVYFAGPEDEHINLTRLFEVHRVRPHLYAARFGVRIKPREPFPRCHSHVIIGPRLSLGVFTDTNFPLVLQTRRNSDDIERLIDFIDSLSK